MGNLARRCDTHFQTRRRTETRIPRLPRHLAGAPMIHCHCHTDMYLQGMPDMRLKMYGCSARNRLSCSFCSSGRFLISLGNAFDPIVRHLLGDSSPTEVPTRATHSSCPTLGNPALTVTLHDSPAEATSAVCDRSHFNRRRAELNPGLGILGE